MSKSLLISAVMLGLACSYLGQIGETKEELSQRYGPAIERSPSDPWHPSDIVDDMCWFRHNNLKITVDFKAGKAVSLQYLQAARFTKRDKRPMSDDEIASILSVAVKKPDWVLISADHRASRWRTSDSSVFAYYFRNDLPWSKSPAPEIGPDYALRVQTADVDAGWRKYWAHLAENLRRNKRD
jgi:hypothetical protein